MGKLITFDPDTHTYTLCGERVPSVTEICRFLHYRAEYADKESRDRAARKGTAIHELTALIDYGEDVEILPELSGYVQAWKNFKRDYRVEILAIEQVVGGYLFGGTGCPLCGTLDRRARIVKQDGIIDIKTGSTVNKVALQGQLTGYDVLDTAHVNDFLLGVYLHADGTYTVYCAPRNYELLISLYGLHKAEQEAKKRWKTTV